jgi:uncharacterized protein (TIGR00156 family)
MKKLLIASVLTMTSGLAMAANTQGFGGFNGPTMGMLTTIEQAQNGRDDDPVQLTGSITHSLGDDEYRFQNGTKNIVIEIDERDWMGLNVSPNDTVTILGELDKDGWEEPKIDVDQIQKYNQKS